MTLKRMFFAAMLLVMGMVAATAQEEQPVPEQVQAEQPVPEKKIIATDKDVRIGKLDNGLTYYIRHNAWPEKRAEFFIAQRVGSIQENGDQRGLAHFLEHMCFNGTRHFKGNEIVKWCETIGVKFGRDLNASTSIDQTVYSISNVPTTREGIVDSCLLILSDWADGLLLEPEEIDKERGVIHEEWRLRTSAQMRMMERSLPRLYPGSKYGYRMPIGLMPIIDHFPPKALRDYYEKWYRPDNQAVIVVGDIVVDSIESKIKTLFGSIKMPENPAPVVVEPVPDNPEPIVVVDKDKEMQYPLVQVMFKTDPVPGELKQNPEYLTLEYKKSAAIAMLNSRLDELAQAADCPYLQAGCSHSRYLLSKAKDAFTLVILPKDSLCEQAVKAVVTEACRAAQFGFTATEYQRHQQSVLSMLDKQYSNRDKRYNVQFCREYVSHYLDQEPIPSFDDYYQHMKQLVPATPIDLVNEQMKLFLPRTLANTVVFSMNQQKEGAVYPTKQSLQKAVDEARRQRLTAWVDNVKDEPLIAQMPQKGKIMKEVPGKKFDYKELMLANGARVVLKHTDLKKDQVVLMAEGKGGSSLYDQQDFANIKFFDDVIEASGLGNFSHTELEKALAGKIAGASLTLDDNRVYVSGSSTPGDVETMLQLVYLYFTKINKDQVNYDKLMTTEAQLLKNRLLQPEAVFADSLALTLSRHNPRFSPVGPDDLNNVSYDRILQMAAEQTQNAAAFTFTIIGNYDEAQLRPLIEQYIASLPGNAKTVRKGRDVEDAFQGKVTCSFDRKMQTPKAKATMTWRNQQMQYTLPNIIRASMVGQILTITYIEKIREEASAAYSVSAQGGLSRNDYRTTATLHVTCPMKPELADTALAIMDAEVKAMAKTVSAEKLRKVKEYMLKAVDDEAKTNAFWLRQINRWRQWNVDTYTDYKKVVEAQTPADIAAFVQQLLQSGNKAEVIMLPEKK